MFTRICKTLTTLSLAVTGVVVLSAVAEAQKVRFVSSTGSNTGNCTRAAPCLTLQRGINKTPAGGELQVLDSGAYGEAITIGKSITISAKGVAATVGRITINAPGATVVLRGLLLSGTGLAGSASGLAVVNAAALHIVGCQIERFPTAVRGITIFANNAKVWIVDTIVRDNSLGGLLVPGSSTGVRLVIDNSRFENNGSDGVNINGLDAEATIERSTLAGNTAAGLRVGTAALARISNSVVTNNLTGLDNVSSGSFSGILLSRRNNLVSGNGTNTSGTITPLGGV